MTIILWSHLKLVSRGNRRASLQKAMYRNAPRRLMHRSQDPWLWAGEWRNKLACVSLLRRGQSRLTPRWHRGPATIIWMPWALWEFRYHGHSRGFPEAKPSCSCGNQKSRCLRNKGRTVWGWWAVFPVSWGLGYYTHLFPCRIHLNCAFCCVLAVMNVVWLHIRVGCSLMVQHMMQHPCPDPSSPLTSISSKQECTFRMHS